MTPLASRQRGRFLDSSAAAKTDTWLTKKRIATRGCAVFEPMRLERREVVVRAKAKPTRADRKLPIIVTCETMQILDKAVENKGADRERERERERGLQVQWARNKVDQIHACVKTMLGIRCAKEVPFSRLCLFASFVLVRFCTFFALFFA
jgi:hypothetical protein